MALKIGSTDVVDNSANWAGASLSTSAIADSAITREKRWVFLQTMQLQTQVQLL